MKKHYLIKRKTNNKPGVPVFFSYSLSQESHQKMEEEGVDPGDLYTFINTECNIQFLCKHRKIDFDLYPMPGGFFISQRFLDAVLEYLPQDDYKIKVVTLLSSKGEAITTRAYYIIQFIRKLDECVIDKEKSTFIKAKYVPREEVTSLTLLNEEIQDDLFQIDSYGIVMELFCSEYVAEKIKHLSVECISTPIDDVKAAVKI
jgi:hypothetical protein